MSSDYISRLRSELLRAGARQPSRWGRPRTARVLRPVVAAAAVALVVAAVVLAVPGGTGDETSATDATDAPGLAYRVEPPTVAAAEQTAEVMRARLATAGIEGAVVSVSPDPGVTITASAAARADVEALAQRGRLGFYDWERSVLGPLAGGTRAEAAARAAAVPGARVVVSEIGGDERWYALRGEPALTGADIQLAAPAADPASGDPIVALGFTARGETAFTALTRALAHRGAAQAVGGDELEASQHFAIVIDDRIVSLPFIGFREAPDGIDGSAGTQIAGGLTRKTARLTAAILSTGPLPAALVDPSEQRSAP